MNMFNYQVKMERKEYLIRSTIFGLEGRILHAPKHFHYQAAFSLLVTPQVNQNMPLIST